MMEKELSIICPLCETRFTSYTVYYSSAAIVSKVCKECYGIASEFGQAQNVANNAAKKYKKTRKCKECDRKFIPFTCPFCSIKPPGYCHVCYMEKHHGIILPYSQIISPPVSHGRQIQPIIPFERDAFGYDALAQRLREDHP